MSFGACSILHYERVRNLYIKGSYERHWPTRRIPKLFGVRDVVNVKFNYCMCAKMFCSLPTTN